MNNKTATFLIYVSLINICFSSNDEITDDITAMQFFDMQQSVLNISQEYFGCDSPELKDRVLTHYVDPKVKNNLTLKEGERHERWDIDACGRAVIVSFLVKVAPERKDWSSFSMRFSEINYDLLAIPNKKLQNKYEELILGEWVSPDNGKDGLWSSARYLADNRIIYTWKNKDYPEGKDTSQYEIIGKVLCNTVVETKNSSTPIGFKICTEIIDMTEDKMVLKKGPAFFKTSPETSYTLVKVK